MDKIKVEQIVDDANANGSNFTPGNSDLFAIIINPQSCTGNSSSYCADPHEPFQVLFITATCVTPYTITASAGAGGSISPSDTVTVDYGADQSFTITPNANYHVADVLVDGSSVGAVTSYTFNIVTANHTISASFALSDLSVSSLTVSGSGATISIGDTTRNGAAGGVVASTTSFYLSTDSTLDAGDAMLGSRAIPALAAGASSTGTTSVTIPAGTAPGTFSIIAKADAPDAIPETNEANNTTYNTIIIGLDLSVSSLTAPATTSPGTTISIGDTTTNSGTVGAGASTTSFYLSTNSALDEGDYQLGSRPVPALAAGASSTGTTSVTIPAIYAGITPGTYYLIAKADAPDAIAETNEATNTAYKTIIIWPDLSVSSLTVPATGGVGATISIGDTTTNSGAGIQSISTTSFYLSANNALDTGDAMLGSRAVPALAAGASSIGTTSVTIPAGTAPGTFSIIAKADAPGAIAEINEANNTSYKTIIIGPDFSAPSLTVPATGGAGSTISIGDTTTNSGGGAADASTTSFYLSANNTLDTGDAMLGSRAVPALAANASSTGTTSVTIPVGTAPGTFYIIAKADAPGAIAEINEANNTAYKTIIIGPDFSAPSLTVPATGGAGSTISIGDTTTNSGAGIQSISTTSFYLSANNALDAGDTMLGSRAVPALATNASSTGTTSVTIPAGTAPGTFYIIAKADAPGAIAETNEANNTAYKTIIIGPDFSAPSLMVPATGGAGSTISIGDTTTNSGGGAADASTTSFYLSANNTLDTGDAMLGSRAVPALAANASSTGTTSVTIPVGTAPGTFYIIAKADAPGAIAEINEANNTSYKTIVIGPDLSASSLTVPATGGAGSTISIGDTTKNSGAGIQSTSTTSFYLSANNALDTGDAMLGSRAVPALATNASSTGTTSVTIPVGTAPGPYYLIAKADAPGAIAETNEANNTAYKTIIIGPDLSASSLTVPATGSTGATISIGDTTKNSGAGIQSTSTTSFYLSANNALDTGDAMLGSRAVPVLAAGASSIGTTSVTIPVGTAPGPYYLIAKADAPGAIAETNEANNTTYKTIVIGPDLSVSSLTVPATGGVGATISIGDTTKNSGTGAAGASTTSLYLSSNNTLDTGDAMLGSRAVPALATNASSTGTTSVTIPVGTAPGTFYIIAKADAPGAIAETNEANNTTYKTIVIGLDLSVSSLTVPATGGVGATISIGDTTKNSGTGAAGASTTSLYLSSNNTLDTGDAMLGSRAVPALATNASSTGTTSVTIPVGTAPGTFYIIAKADAPGAIAETNEANNTTYKTIVIGLDLSVSSLTVPATGGVGATISIGDTTKNSGTGAAGASTTSLYLSSNNTLDTGDAMLGSRAVPALATNASSTGTTSVTIPVGTAPGTFYIIAKADAPGAIAETNEANNTTYKTIVIGLDLSVSSLTVPATGGVGATISIGDTTKNSGTGAAGASTTSLYLSSNNTLDAGDAMLGSRAVPALAT
ncbi:MAG: CARDB domain-containing protein, partial [Thermodesulfovibrionales bacterium]|nr:CARDB domain-containing protein [Thermodesulfovibrionales bacterium]